MIPKTIHYCWFGGKLLPKYAKRNIESWKKFFTDYEIKEWNEVNFNVNMIPYTNEAYKKKKFAFVSDFARYWILYNYGGLYFDTDVEIIKSFDAIIERGPFLGIEKSNNLISVNPGLCMGANLGMNFYKKMIDFYFSLEIHQQESIKPYLVKQTTDFLFQDGLKKEDILQLVDDIWIYPNDFFNPLDDYTGKIFITKNSHSIHYYRKSWVNNYGPIRNYLSRFYHRLLNL